MKRELVTAAGDVELTEVDAASGPGPASRMRDTAHFWAGGYMMNNWSGATCSTGFSVWHRGFQATTTARHCRGTDYRARDAATTYYNSGTREWSRDGAARVLGASGGGYMYDGEWHNAQSYDKRVSQLQDVGLGAYICTSGGNSGVHCGLRVENMWGWFNDGYGSFHNIGAVNHTGGIAVAQGDSGGPVFMPYTDGSVGAVGMIQCYAWDNPCPPPPNGLGDCTVHCSTGVLFTSMRTIINNLDNAALVTG